MKALHLHTLEVVEAIDTLVHSLQLQPKEAIGVMAKALSTPTVDGELSPKILFPQIEKLYDSQTTNLSYRNNKDLHIVYYLSADVGIAKIRTYTNTGQERIYKVRDNLNDIMVYNEGPQILMHPLVLGKLHRVVKALRIMNGHYLPDAFYEEVLKGRSER